MAEDVKDSVAGDQGLGAIGLVGLGNMGSAIARRLSTSARVHGHDIDEARVVALREACDLIPTDLQGMTETCDTILLSLPKPSASEAVMASLLAAPGRLRLVVETSTITPNQARSSHRDASRAGIDYVDAAVLSGVGEVERGESGWLIGGEDAAVNRALPILERICARTFLLGGPGAGMAAKVVNNGVAHAVMVVLAEAAALAQRNGIALNNLCRVLAQDDAGLKRPLTARLAGRYARGDFNGGMPTEAARKDSALFLEMARHAGVPLFAHQSVDAVYEIAMAKGHARDDYAVVANLWDDWSGPVRS
jgi:3-hydroxyisobutyrate dehydrogenase-like beta-hydroxyacid dehydrogenase